MCWAVVTAATPLLLLALHKNRFWLCQHDSVCPCAPHTVHSNSYKLCNVGLPLCTKQAKNHGAHAYPDTINALPLRSCEQTFVNHRYLWLTLLILILLLPIWIIWMVVSFVVGILCSCRCFCMTPEQRRQAVGLPFSPFFVLGQVLHEMLHPKGYNYPCACCPWNTGVEV